MDANEMYLRLRNDAERVRAVDSLGQGASRIVSALQTACDYIDADRDWHYNYRTFEVSCLSGDQPLLPATFKTFGIAGGVALWLNALGTGRKKTLWPLSMWKYYRLRDMGLTGEPSHYAPGEGVNTSSNRYFFLHPTTNKNITLDVMGKRVFPRFVLDFPADNDAPITNPNVLLEIPEGWHDLVVFQWALLYLMRDKANAQTRTDQKALAEAGLQKMRNEERHGREAIHHLAPFGAGVIC